jgi:hypothetical protein
MTYQEPTTAEEVRARALLVARRRAEANRVPPRFAAAPARRERLAPPVVPRMAAIDRELQWGSKGKAILLAACTALNVRPQHVFGSRGNARFVEARLVVYFLMLEHTGLGVSHVGKATNRHHSTVFKGYIRVKRDMVKFAPLIETVKAFRPELFA